MLQMLVLCCSPYSPHMSSNSRLYLRALIDELRVVETVSQRQLPNTKWEYYYSPIGDSGLALWIVYKLVETSIRI